MTRSLPPEWDDDRRSGDGGDPQGNLAPTDWKVIIVAALCGAALGSVSYTHLTLPTILLV